MQTWALRGLARQTDPRQDGGMDPGSKAAIFIVAGVLVTAGGWGLFRWLVSIHEDRTASDGEEADDPAEQVEPQTHSTRSNDP
jgi:hypothetical protein